MGFFDRGFDPATVESDSYLTPSTESYGYPVVVKRVMWRDTKAGTGRYLQIDIEGEYGEHGGEFGSIRLNLEHQNEVAVQIATSELKRICTAQRPHLTLTDPKQLVGWKFNVCVREQLDKPEYTEVYAIRRYRRGGEGVGTGTFMSESQLAAKTTPNVAPSVHAGSAKIFGSESSPRTDKDGVPFL